MTAVRRREMAPDARQADDGTVPTTDERSPAEPGHLVPRWLRLFGMLAMMAVFVVSAFSDATYERRGWRLGLEIVALCLMFVLLLIISLDDRLELGRRRGLWAMLMLMVAISVAIPLYDGPGWIGTTAVAAAMVGRFLPMRPTVVIVGVLVAYTIALPYIWHANTGLALFALLPIAGAVFPYQTQRRMRIIRELRETRAELARVAVADERLRIARDLHDLLGHSLSVITLKSELAGRMVDADPARARAEMAEVEAVARRSLTEVREAVTAYRRPTLDAELAAARGALAAAGVEARVDVTSGGALPDEVDALLAWAVREGVTNVVRHSRARHCTIRLSPGAETTLEVTDDGTGGTEDEPAGGTEDDGTTPAGRAAGSGLTGLRERAGQLGGTLTAGPRRPGGFRLTVTIPVPAPQSSHNGDAAGGKATEPSPTDTRATDGGRDAGSSSGCSRGVGGRRRPGGVDADGGVR